MPQNRRLLRRALVVAARIEGRFAQAGRLSPGQLVAFGSLVRNRRLAQVLRGIPETHAYEALAIIRCMVEVQVNLAWIRKDLDTRAKRFLRFEPLERLEMVREIPESVPAGRAQEVLRKLEAQRDALRGVFGEPRRDGNIRWAKHWATTPVLRKRLDELMAAEGSTGVPFMYVLYRWASSVIHGGPVAVASVLRKSNRGSWHQNPQPLSQATSVYAGGGVTLLGTTSDAAAVLNVPDRDDIAALMGAFQRRFRPQSGERPAP